ncbi:AraC family transcriptional regulator [Amycolatopsis sp. SID8362]|uniref:helix-turn-helix domain-containing protein n=1 Tax=Amycolatopsis sp. SID8362 TaxID=2690346 RepID=UPI0013D1643E|nr:AraC family transcriptional regulator [Amycolatopsis sp. SID8362]NED47895.1 helix-turn-helix transcriptional regulator [Amycolatopsis sp. SID8362]
MMLRSIAAVGNDSEFGEPRREPALERVEKSVRPAVLQAISSIQERYFEPITLAELASEVFVSRFHFSRMFAEATGVTPGRFLTAVRLFEAKRLLLTTSLNVSDIVCSVGYSSVGTFTSRFSRAVGMTPTQYREPQVAELLVAISPTFQRLPPLRTLRAAGRSCASLQTGSGVLSLQLDMPRGSAPADTLVGLFADPVPQCGPVAFGGMANMNSGELTIHGVPAGRWTAIAVAQHQAGTAGPRFSIGYSPVQVAPHGQSTGRVGLRAPASTDAPIAITLASKQSPFTQRMLAAQRPHLRAVA